MTKPMVSIIIPAYNIEDVGMQIVESIINQSFTDFELILIDDGSTDDTLSTLRQFEEKDLRIRTFTKTNGGPSSARNVGIHNALGKYILFFDADDDIKPDAINIVMSSIESGKSDLVVSGWSIRHFGSGKEKTILPHEEIVTENINKHIVKSLGDNGLFYNLWNKLFVSSIVKKNHLSFREDLRFGEDLLFVLDYAKFMKRVHVISQATYLYNSNSSSSVFASSSINPSAREINDKALLDFIGDKQNIELVDLTNWVRWRWLISYWSLVARSKNTFRHKIKLIESFGPRGVTVVKSPKHIGHKKYFIQIIASIARRSSVTSFIFGKAISSGKRLVMLIKSLKHRHPVS